MISGVSEACIKLVEVCEKCEQEYLYSHPEDECRPKNIPYNFRCIMWVKSVYDP
jgi:ribosomal protein L7Ae-like RNA K-turn-binding protein